MRSETCGSAPSASAIISPKPRWCSTLCTSSARLASQTVDAPEPYSKTRIGRLRAASQPSTWAIAP